jgi:DNA-binding transcriptional MerR regulator
VNEAWTLAELVDEVAARLAALPAPKNGQVRAVPDDRTIRYYGTIGLLDRPALRGRTALYGGRHLAQVVAIKRLQGTGKSLAEIQALWPQLTDETLMSLSGVPLPAKGRAPARKEFWKREPTAAALAPAAPITPRPAPQLAPVELRVELAPHVVLTIAMPDDGGALALSHADVRAIRAAAAPLVAELANRRLTPHAGEEEP